MKAQVQGKYLSRSSTTEIQPPHRMDDLPTSRNASLRERYAPPLLKPSNFTKISRSTSFWFLTNRWIDPSHFKTQLAIRLSRLYSSSYSWFKVNLNPPGPLFPPLPITFSISYYRVFFFLFLSWTRNTLLLRHENSTISSNVLIDAIDTLSRGWIRVLRVRQRKERDVSRRYVHTFFIRLDVARRLSKWRTSSSSARCAVFRNTCRLLLGSVDVDQPHKSMRISSSLSHFLLNSMHASDSRVSSISIVFIVLSYIGIQQTPSRFLSDG